MFHSSERQSYAVLYTSGGGGLGKFGKFGVCINAADCIEQLGWLHSSTEAAWPPVRGPAAAGVPPTNLPTDNCYAINNNDIFIYIYI